MHVIFSVLTSVLCYKVGVARGISVRSHAGYGTHYLSSWINIVGHGTVHNYPLPVSISYFINNSANLPLLLSVLYTLVVGHTI